VVAAAGNDGLGNKRYPAAEKDVMAVGAHDRGAEQLAPFANHGDWVEVAAPGVGVLSALPGGGFGTWSGSSMAAPFVAGQAAVLAALAPDEKSKKIVDAIRKSSRKPGRGNKVKHGLIDILGSIDELD
jgi:subtilisin family serine protease